MFSQATWLLPLKMRLQNFLSNHQVPHALLVYGNRGIGIEQTMEIFAQQLLCTQPENPLPCHQCEACRLFASQHHPDYFYCQEQPSVEVIRTLRERLAQTCHFHRRVIVLTAVEELNIAAANALLKSLEEPSENTVFLLSAHKNTVLPAIHSRCIPIRVTPANEHLIEWMQQKHPKYDASKLTLALNMSANNLEKACQLLIENELDERQQCIDQLLFSGNNKSSWTNDVQQYISSNPDEALYLIYYKTSEFIHKTMINAARNISTQTGIQNGLNGGCEILKPLFYYQDSLIEAMSAFQSPGINKCLLLQSLIYHWRIKLYPKLPYRES